MTAATSATPTAAASMQHPNAGTPEGTPVIDRLAINTLRTLAMDAVQAANSGHPGAPMGLAPVGYALWQDVMVSFALKRSSSFSIICFINCSSVSELSPT